MPKSVVATNVAAYTLFKLNRVGQLCLRNNHQGGGLGCLKPNTAQGLGC